jgi:peptide/nickel transport system substrate-binding protein
MSSSSSSQTQVIRSKDVEYTRREIFRLASALGITIPAATALAASIGLRTGSSSVGAQEADRPSLVLAQGGALQYLDPNLNLSGVQLQVHKLTHNVLVDYDNDNQLIPSLAESWDIVDATTYVFHLRQGVKFHDGSELKASDVKFSLERCTVHGETMLVTTSSSCAAENHFSSIDVVDDYTVRLNLGAPFAPLLGQLSYSWRIVPEAVVTELGAEEFNANPIGTGPFRIVTWDRATGDVVLEAFDEYFEGPPALGQITIRAIPEDSTRVSALRSGEVDIITNVPAESIPLIEQDSDLRVESAEANRFLMLLMNDQIPPFDNKLVRQAVSHAIDWPTIVDTVLGGQATYMPIPITPFDFPYDELADLAESLAYPYDPDRSVELLSEAGYGDGFSVDLEGPTGRTPKDVEVLSAAAGYLQAVGINATPTPLEWGYYNTERFLGRQLAMGFGSMANPIRDFDWIFSVHLDPNRRSLFYSDPALTELGQAGIRETDPEARIAIYREAMTLLMEEAPFAFGYMLKNTYGVNNAVQWTARPGEEQVLLYEASKTDQ